MTRGRTAKTLGVNAYLLGSRERMEHVDIDPQGLLTQDVVRLHIKACICPFCGSGPFKSVSGHTNRAHGIDRHELRTWAGMLGNQSIASPETACAARERALLNNSGRIVAEYSHAKAGKPRGSSETLSHLARAAMGANMAKYNASLTSEQRSERARALSVGQSLASRAKQGASLKAWHLLNPKSPERLALDVERLHSPAAREKAAAASSARKHGHGTVAKYNHGGCRCDCSWRFIGHS